ncbi:MAG: IgGFc-binding protein [Sandaracinaceae bacterium]|nr:IgGFc-binding protein [Sandaracinaceae bacterium]
MSAESTACIDNVYHFCVQEGEFFREEQRACEAPTPTCVPGMGCLVCRPGAQECIDGHPHRCKDDGSGWVLVERCEVSEGEICRRGQCVNLCEVALYETTYVGCEFFALDLDNAAIGAGRDASSQQYAVVVSNPSPIPAEVQVEIDDAPYGTPSRPRRIMSVIVPPNDLEILRLPRREVDGSSSFVPCERAGDPACAPNEACYCQGGRLPGPGARDCRCRTSPMGRGLNDGTHSAISSNAYRIRSNVPLIAYQFNPLDNVGVFSNDASLLLPTGALGATYTVIGWPQTIAHSEDPREDFDPDATDEDLRAFLTIVGTREGTRLRVQLGPLVRRVVGLGETTRFYRPGDLIEVELGEFDVLNLETQAFNGDFTGTVVEANAPVAVFTGSEASDAPRFNDLANRRCCADHLEEQLFPDRVLGYRFFIGKSASRTQALNRAFVTADRVGEFDEPEYVRILGVSPDRTAVVTSLPPPHDYFELERGESVILTIHQDLEIVADRPIAVLQVLASQEAVGIPSRYPGGDPAIIAVPPVEQYRKDYVFLVPQYYAFDFITIIAPRDAQIWLDDILLQPEDCVRGPADGRPRRRDEPPPDWLVHRCQLSFPDVIGSPNVRIEPGDQGDGYHTLRSSQEVGLIVWGFDAYVSYAYAGGLDLEPLW